MKQLIILISVFFILSLSVFNAIEDKTQMHEHHMFFKKMSNFADKGKRFTAKDGLELCDAINLLKLRYEPIEIELLDCNRFDNDN